MSSPDPSPPSALFAPFYRVGGLLRRPTILRLMLFGLGGVLSYLLNTGVFVALRTRAGLTEEIAYAFSLTIMTTVTFSWSYFVNFRTSQSLRSCLPRYLAAIGVCYALNYALAQTGFNLWPSKPKLVILVVMAVIALVKFFIYHKWVFPRDPASSK